jgi:hypothetical protein
VFTGKPELDIFFYSSTMLNFDVKAIQPGAYIIRVQGENAKFTPIRVVKM